MKNCFPPIFFNTRWLTSAALAATGLLAMAPAQATGDLEPMTSSILSEPGSAGLGTVVRVEASPYREVGNRYDLLPLYLYEGERFFLHANRGGVKLLHDVGGFSKGSEARLNYSYDWRSGPWRLRPSIGVALRDARLNNYYYGVQDNEATPGRPAYAPGTGINASLGLYGSYDMTQRWRLLAGVSATLLDRRLRDSPIVQKRVLPAVYIGAAYDFGGHEREWARQGSPTWFKLLYGKSTEDGCHLLKIVTAQCLSTDKVNPTRITALQVGKPFLENVNGWPLDFVGYAGLTGHNDNGYQPNSVQLDLFMKAFYSGFPWSHRVKTRLGLGVGVSLAQRVPYIEASSQAASGKPASRILNYLDPTLDVSLGDLLGSRALKDTFIGVGVSHRSGIFGDSRLLGNVNGGSNYIYTYVESAL